MTMLSDGMLLGVDSGLRVQDVFDIQLWTGNNTAGRVITFDMPGDMYWIKRRTDNTGDHVLVDKIRGANNYFSSNTNLAPVTTTINVTGLSGSTITLGNAGVVNTVSSSTYVGWGFKEQTGFFDIVTYTGTGSVQNLSHGLGVVPAMIMVKRIDNTGAPSIYHIAGAASPGTVVTQMNATTGFSALSGYWNNTDATSSQFTIGTEGTVNFSGGQYIAYLWAHNPSGFIQGGSYTGNGNTSGPSINLGWQPQFLLIKQRDSTNQWYMLDATRGMGAGSEPNLIANGNSTENSNDYVSVSGAGFALTSSSSSVNGSGQVYVYLAVKAE